MPTQQKPKNTTTKPRQEMKNQTPSKETDYIGKHFPRANVQNAKRGEDDAYEVELTGGTHLKFEQNNDISSIRSSSELHESVILEYIHNYIISQHINNKLSTYI